MKVGHFNQDFIIDFAESTSIGPLIAACDEEEPDVEIQTEGDQMRINLIVPRGWMR